MASKSLALEIAGGRTTSPFFDRRYLLQRQIPKLSLLRVNPSCGRKLRAAASLTVQPTPENQSYIIPAVLDPLSSFSRNTEDVRGGITPEIFDDLMHDSVKEIVRNVRKAPFLMKIFLGGGEPVEEKWRLLSSSPRLSLEREVATADRWPEIMKRWEHEKSVPDGVILVEELKEEKEGTAANAGNRDDAEVRRWGVLIEGRGTECSACYILDTYSVSSSIGRSTHFCLVKAKCLGDPVGVQVLKAWLQRGSGESEGLMNGLMK